MNNLIKTELCDLFEIEYPILCGGMIWASNSDLVSAVSEAGCLGLLAGGSMGSPDSLKEEIERVRDLTDNTFGVNIPLLYPGASELIDVCVDEEVKVVVTSAGSPKRFTGLLKEKGIRVIHVSPSVNLAMKAEGVGVDAVVVEGTEAGGHNSPDDITTMVLVPQVVDALKIPVIAAGGIADARGFIAARALGAKGIQMGTRFIASKECSAHPLFKEAIINAIDNSTILTGRNVMPSPVRMLKNRLADEILGKELSGVKAEELHEMIGPGRSYAAIIEGDVENGSTMSGQVAGMIKEILSVKEIVNNIIQGAGEILKGWG